MQQQQHYHGLRTHTHMDTTLSSSHRCETNGFRVCTVRVPVPVHTQKCSLLSTTTTTTVRQRSILHFNFYIFLRFRWFVLSLSLLAHNQYMFLLHFLVEWHSTNRPFLFAAETHDSLSPHTFSPLFSLLLLLLMFLQLVSMWTVDCVVAGCWDLLKCVQHNLAN